MLEANIFQRTNLSKSNLLMDFQRTLIIAIADNSNHLPIAVSFCPGNDVAQQRFSCPPTLCVRVNINRIFESVAVGVAFTVTSEITRGRLREGAESYAKALASDILR